MLPSRATALTSIGLEHTEWLGDTEEEIAAEKLAVLRDHSTLVVGRVGEGVSRLAERTAAERNARLIVAGDSHPGLRLPVPGAYQRRNFAVAAAVAEAILGTLDPDLTRAVAERLELPGRVQLLEGDPPLILDAAHNPDGARALAEALPEAVGEAPVVACLAILAEKDAAGVLEALAPRLDARRLHRAPGRAPGASRSPRRPGAGGIAIGGVGGGGRAGSRGGPPRAEGRAGARPRVGARVGWDRPRHRVALPPARCLIQALTSAGRHES